MQESLREFQEQKLANEREAMNVDMECLDIESLQDSGPSDLSRKKKKMGIASYFPSDVKIGSQPTIKAALQSKERWHEVDLAIARFFYDACIPINVVNSSTNDRCYSMYRFGIQRSYLSCFANQFVGGVKERISIAC